MQEQMGNERTTLGNLRKNEREMLEIKNIVREMKMPLMSSSVDWMQPKKESQSLKICRYKALKLKSKVFKKWKKKNLT